MRESVNRLWTWALLVFAAHNAEEVLAFANGWPEQHLPRLAWATQQWPLFAIATVALTSGVALAAWCLRARPERSVWWLRVFLGVMLLNAIWHVGVSAYTWSLAPGVVTSVVLIAPIYTTCLRRLSNRGLAPRLAHTRVPSGGR